MGRRGGEFFFSVRYVKPEMPKRRREANEDRKS